jgi:hypothetical protein
MVDPYPENVARLDVDWEDDVTSAQEEAYDAMRKSVCDYKEEEPRADWQADEAQLEHEDRRARDAQTDARCRRLGLIVAKRMPVIHQRRCGRTGR